MDIYISHGRLPDEESQTRHPKVNKHTLSHHGLQDQASACMELPMWNAKDSDQGGGERIY